MMARHGFLLAGAVACVLVGAWLAARREAHEHSPDPVRADAAPAEVRRHQADGNPGAPAEPAQASSPSALETQAAVERPQPAPIRQTPPRNRSGGNSPLAATAGKGEVQDPMARAALAFVGADPDAEAYWNEAINDPRLPANERQDLIEDLNEDGLSDPDNPTYEDLPLILSRLELIERLAPSAMDQVNADAFAEAHKDLLEMATRLLRDTGNR